MSVRDVKNAFAAVTADRKVDAKEVDQVLEAAGTISADEERAFKEEADKFIGMFDAGAKEKLRERLGEISDLRQSAARVNREYARVAPQLTSEAKALLKEGAATKSYGGSQIPQAVKKTVNAQLANGAVAYDVRELKPDPVLDTEHGDPKLTVDGRFNPYAQDQQATDSMAFSHTELTPGKIADDMNSVQTFNVLKGYRREGNNQIAEYERVTMKPNGRITDLYDEASWPDTLARGPGGQKYASNFAILADGSVHCVPASRRTASEPWRILTTASLARGKHMLFNGHLRMENGVVNYVGMSGRLCKLEERGEAKFVDPIEILKAWGFKLAPGLQVTNEG